MQVFRGKVRPGGDIGTEIVRKDLTAAEVMVLREIHGSDSVVGLELVKNDRRDLTEEYERLVRKYSKHADGRKALHELFGSPQNPNMPSTLKGFKDDKASKVTAKSRAAQAKASESEQDTGDDSSKEDGAE